MNVLLLGADGFLGRHLQIALETAGHTVRRGVHRPVRRTDEIAVDYTRDIDPDAWRGRLTGVDAVINTVGILREGRGRHSMPSTTRRPGRSSPPAARRACAA